VLLLGTGPDAVTVAAAHAGWRGLADGVLQEAVGCVRAAGATKVEWLLGPCIGPTAYEFGERDLSDLVARYGPSLVATTADGAPALDLRAGVRVALAEAGAHPLALDDWRHDAVPCTATDEGPEGPRWFSWRARRDAGRQVAAVRIGEWPL
jgi:copper oxidase (laccase) domain-containing protein